MLSFATPAAHMRSIRERPYSYYRRIWSGELPSVRIPAVGTRVVIDDGGPSLRRSGRITISAERMKWGPADATPPDPSSPSPLDSRTTRHDCTHRLSPK